MDCNLRLRKTQSQTAGDTDCEMVDSDDYVLSSDQEEPKCHTGVAKTAANTISPGGFLSTLFCWLPIRWRDLVIRGITTVLMMVFFLWLIHMGPLAFIAVILIIQVKCFSEIINIGYAVYRIHGLPWFRSLSWYLLLCSNYFFYGESLVDNFIVLVQKLTFLRLLVSYHRLISFLLYIVGIVWFVLSLVKRYYMKQFSLFAWTHIALLIVVTQSYLIIQNLFHGLIWFIVPVSMIFINDVMAYMCGFFFGKTPLIKLSPKKTWEGFIGGGICTIVLGLIFAQSLCHIPYFACPLVYNETIEAISFDCSLPAHFQPQEFQIPLFIAFPLYLFGFQTSISFSPFLIHAFFMALFCSIIGPFGGFFASGFKRAFKIKDFGDLFPGHGGFMDRFDCQFLMATFVNVYIHAFVQSVSTSKVLQMIFSMDDALQLEVFTKLRDHLISAEILA